MADSNNDKERNREKSGTMMMLRVRPIVTKRILRIFLPKGHRKLTFSITAFWHLEIKVTRTLFRAGHLFVMYAVWGLNPRPRDYESLALTG